VTATALVCHACGSEPRQGARFCDACGAALKLDVEPAEFKQVTVLFADVVGSMEIAAALGPERLREVMAELVSQSAAVVERYGGTVDKFTGDGIMALFGAPITLEQHALRACLAAMDIQRAAERLATEVQRTDGIDLRVRIGLNSGQVIAGDVGATHLAEICRTDITIKEMACILQRSYHSVVGKRTQLRKAGILVDRPVEESA